MPDFLQSLNKLSRLENYRIELARRQAALVSRQIEARLSAIDANARHVNAERLIAGARLDGGATLNAFIDAKRGESRVYADEIERLKKTLEEIEASLLDMYAESKRFEKIKDNELAKRIVEANRLETRELDEIAARKQGFRPA